MSASDIDKGTRGFGEIARALEGIKVGIVCLTPENLKESWILYESGALSKTVDARTRLYTLLLGDLKPEEVPPPLGLFQATKTSKSDIGHLVSSINKAVSNEPLSETVLQQAFDRAWPDLDARFNAFPPSATVPAKRPTEDLLAEILGHIRKLAAGPDDRGLSREELWILQGNYYKASPEAWRDVWEYMIKLYGRDEPVRATGRAALLIQAAVVEVAHHDGTYTRYEGVEKWDAVKIHSKPSISLGD